MGIVGRARLWALFSQSRSTFILNNFKWDGGGWGGMQLERPGIWLNSPLTAGESEAGGGGSAQARSAAGSKAGVPGQPSQLWIGLAVFAES